MNDLGWTCTGCGGYAFRSRRYDYAGKPYDEQCYRAKLRATYACDGHVLDLLDMLDRRDEVTEAATAVTEAWAAEDILTAPPGALAMERLVDALVVLDDSAARAGGTA